LSKQNLSEENAMPAKIIEAIRSALQHLAFVAHRAAEMMLDAVNLHEHLA